MTTINDNLSIHSIPKPSLLTTSAQEVQLYLHRLLDQAYLHAPHISFDDNSKLILFSDAHRGDNSRADAFVHNKPIFMHALRDYYERDFTYVEVGDGDELWKNPDFATIRRAHSDVYELLHTFDSDNRLHMLTGNHDTRDPEVLTLNKDGIISREAIILDHRHTGQKLFVVHGHQLDLSCTAFHHISQSLVEIFLRGIQQLGLYPAAETPRHYRYETSKAWPDSFCSSAHLLERRMRRWINSRRQLIICGHSHAPVFPRPGDTPYFNTGGCIFKDFISGIEIERGTIQMVKWARQGGRIQRYAVTSSIPLASYQRW